MCVMKSLPVVSISSYAPPAHCRASGAASGGALGRSAPPRAARAPPFSFLPNTEKLPHFAIEVLPLEIRRSRLRCDDVVRFGIRNPRLVD